MQNAQTTLRRRNIPLQQHRASPDPRELRMDHPDQGSPSPSAVWRRHHHYPLSRLLSKKRTFLLQLLVIQVPTLQRFWCLSEALYPTPEIMWKFLPRAGFKQLFRVQCEQAQVTGTVAVTSHSGSLNINSASAPKANSAL